MNPGVVQLRILIENHLRRGLERNSHAFLIEQQGILRLLRFCYINKGNHRAFNHIIEGAVGLNTH